MALRGSLSEPGSVLLNTDSHSGDITFVNIRCRSWTFNLQRAAKHGMQLIKTSCAGLKVDVVCIIIIIVIFK